MTSCGISKPSSEPTATAPVILPELPYDLRKCDGPAPIDWSMAVAGIMLPEGLYQGWLAERAANAVCAHKLEQLAGFYLRLKANYASAVETSPAQ